MASGRAEEGPGAQREQVVLHLQVGNRESEADWTEFFRGMISPGLRVPTSVTADGAPGLINAIGVCFRRSIRIRCWFHRMVNILAKVPEEARAELDAHLPRCATPRHPSRDVPPRPIS